jgi:tRNA (pseudouridine54-N1)-methyltransferase
MLSNDIRRNVELYLVLMGEPDPPKSLHFSGTELKYLNPDERSTGALVKNALMKNVGPEWAKSTPGISVSRKGFADVLEDFKGRRLIYLKEEGASISKIPLKENDVFVLGGKEDLSPGEEALIQAWPHIQKISLGPRSLHADHCITVVLNNLDSSA